MTPPRFTLVTLGLVAALTGWSAPTAAQDHVKATEATFRNASRTLGSAFRSDLKPVAAQLKAGLADTVSGLAAGELSADGLPEALYQAFATAYEDALDAYAADLSELERVGSFLLADLAAADPDASVPDDLLRGGGGELDSHHARLQRDLDAFNAALDRELGRALKKLRQLLPDEGRLTADLFPLRPVQGGEPGLLEDAPQTGFTCRQPLLLAGYGDGSLQRIAVLGSAGEAQKVNVYNADGALVLLELATTPPVPHGLYGAVIDVPVDSQLSREQIMQPHGNLRIEMHANGSGWTYAIGY